MQYLQKYGHLLYSRGFFLVEGSDFCCLPFTWNAMEFGKYVFCYDPKNEVFYKNDSIYELILSGILIDTKSEIIDKAKIASLLLEKKKKSDIEFYNYLDILAGNYLIILHNKQNGLTWILSDASGMRSINYSIDPKHKVVSSHANLIGKLCNLPTDTGIFVTGYGYPGDRTPFENVRRLVPNHLLEIETGKVIRFFPREELKNGKMEHIAEEISKNFEIQLKLLANKYSFMASLSAGIDSRTTLALLKNFTGSCLFFTYFDSGEEKNAERRHILNTDRDVAVSITENLNLNYKLIDIKNFTPDQEFINLCNENGVGYHAINLTYSYLTELPNDYLHIRSNVAEIGTVLYKKRPKPLTPKSMADCFCPNPDQSTIDIYQEFYDKYQYENSLFNYDKYDILYWEYRMCAWLNGIVIQESDLAHNTYILFNCRNILKMMLSVSEIDRVNRIILKRMIRIKWPILNAWKFNENMYNNKWMGPLG